MRLTPALAVRQLLAKLHPPLPRSLRESQQLLNVLETSFRKHLDETHPSPKSQSGLEASLHNTIPLTSSHSSSSATQHHLSTILTHPLLERKIIDGSEGMLETRLAFERFQGILSQARVTIDLLTAYVSMYLSGLNKGESVALEHRLAPLISAWMHSSSAAQKYSFLTSPAAMGRTVSLMALDGEEATVWSWLQMVYERRLGSDTEKSDLPISAWSQIEDALVSQLMRLAIERVNLVDAAQQFVEACRYRLASRRALLDPHSEESSLGSMPMRTSWSRLASAIIFFRKQHGIPVELFDEALRLGASWSDAPLLSEPFVSIYHPSTPSAQLLCMNLRNAGSAAAFIKDGANARKARRKATLVALLDAAQLSLDQNMQRDAQFLLEFSSPLYPELLPKATIIKRRDLDQQLRDAWTRLRQQSTNTSQLQFT